MYSGRLNERCSSQNCQEHPNLSVDKIACIFLFDIQNFILTGGEQLWCIVCSLDLKEKGAHTNLILGPGNFNNDPEPAQHLLFTQPRKIFVKMLCWFVVIYSAARVCLSAYSLHFLFHNNTAERMYTEHCMTIDTADIATCNSADYICQCVCVCAH